MKNKQKGFETSLLIVVVSLSIIGYVIYVYQNKKINNTIANNSDTVINAKITPLIDKISSTTPKVYTSKDQTNPYLTKAIKSISDNIIKNGNRFFVDTVPQSYSLYYYEKDKAIISVKELGDPAKRPSYSLYTYNNGQVDLIRKNYFSGLIDGWPEIEIDKNNPLFASINTGYGDICFSESNTIYFDLSKNNLKISDSSQSNGCESFDSMSFKNQDGEIFKIEPILSNICSNNNQGEKSIFSGLKAVSKDKTFSLNFTVPVNMICKKNGNDGFYLYNKSISFTDLKYKSLNNFTFSINIYDIKTENSEKGKIDFSFENGFKLLNSF